MPDSPCPEGARTAVDLMTAWLASPDGPPDLLISRLANHIQGHPGGDLYGAVTLIMGQIYLCGSLLALREHETGITPLQTVRDLGLEYAQN